MSGPPVRVAVAGALGRMGQAVALALSSRDGVVFVGGFDRGDAAGAGLTTRDEALAAADVVVDFTSAAASARLAGLCAARGGPALVLGATGFAAEEEAEVAAAAARVAIVKSGNFSPAVNVLLGLVRQAAAALPAALYDIEVVEAHHRRKADAPSGTALMLGAAAAEGRGTRLADVQSFGREGLTGPRPMGEIGFSALRGGGIIGEHQVMFAGDDEILTIGHSARDRGLFARGAVDAAVFAASRGPGLYDMQDVLGMRGPARRA